MAMYASLRRRVREPILWAGVSQLFKTVLATVIAWVLAAHAFNLEQVYLAPWAALLTVHATVFETLRGGVRQAGGTVLAILVAFAAGQLFGLSTVSLGAAIPVGLLLGSVRGLRGETTIAATALIVLTNGSSDNGGILGARLVDTGVGIAVGLLVNLLVWPPLRDRSAASQINAVAEAIGGVLSEIACACPVRTRLPTLMTGSPGPTRWTARSIAHGAFSLSPVRADGSTRAAQRPGGCAPRRVLMTSWGGWAKRSLRRAAGPGRSGTPVCRPASGTPPPGTLAGAARTSRRGDQHAGGCRVPYPDRELSR